MEKQVQEKEQPEFKEINWKWWRDNTLVCDPLWDYVNKRNAQIMENEDAKDE